MGFWIFNPIGVPKIVAVQTTAAAFNPFIFQRLHLETNKGVPNVGSIHTQQLFDVLPVPTRVRFGQIESWQEDLQITDMVAFLMFEGMLGTQKHELHYEKENYVLLSFCLDIMR